MKYSEIKFIDASEIDEEIKRLDYYEELSHISLMNAAKIEVLEELKSKLIDATPILTKAHNEGERYGWVSQKTIGNLDECIKSYGNNIKSLEQFLNCELQPVSTK